MPATPKTLFSLENATVKEIKRPPKKSVESEPLKIVPREKLPEARFYVQTNRERKTAGEL